MMFIALAQIMYFNLTQASFFTLMFGKLNLSGESEGLTSPSSSSISYPDKPPGNCNFQSLLCLHLKFISYLLTGQ